MSLLVVTGYASLDYPVDLAGPLRTEGTTIVRHRDAAAWPRPGGCPTYIAAAALRAGRAAAPVMWIGRGSEGRILIDSLAAQGARTDGIAVVDAPRSPAAIMVHQPEGGTACLFDPALGGQETLGPAQRALIAAASHLCISVGPPQVQRQILDLCPADARLYWAVKDDPQAFGPDLRAALAARADVIFHNAAERPLVGRTRAVTVETRGRRDVIVTSEGTGRGFAVDPLEVRDATGAGDTFAGGFIAAEMGGADPWAAAQAGIAAARTFLDNREKER
ncbi:MAG: carbohydrate kinase family protein [Rubellimicrobium sp.]|nr:carbohydrate kinase family protein [Rubellimicrobium sp.]